MTFPERERLRQGGGNLKTCLGRDLTARDKIGLIQGAIAAVSPAATTMQV